MFFNKLKLLVAKHHYFIVFLTISILIYSVVIHLNTKKVSLDCFPKHINKYLNTEEQFVRTNTSSVTDMLWANLDKLNKKSEVRNVFEYGPVSSETPILVVCVHRDLQRLQLLVASLALVAGVDDLLLIFSHAYYDQRINHLIQQIDFCMVLQIFYPKSIQRYPDSYSDLEAEECAHGATNCSRRELQLTEPKHHWWWTVNFVFNQLVWPQPHTDMVIFIDDSSYVLPDVMFMLDSAKYSMRYFPDVDVISLGRAPAAPSHSDRLTVEVWLAAHGNGLSFNRSTWEKISALGWHYCEYDDPSWSHSLLHLFRRFPGGRALAVAALAPRVLATGALPRGPRALHHLCWLTSHYRLFPRRVQAVVLFGREGKVLTPPDLPAKGNGGWSDVFNCYDISLAEIVTTALPEPD